jgi:hypothetical protein
MDEARWPIMQYKVSPIDVLWNLKDGSTIWLSKEDATGRTKLLAKVSNLVPFHLIWGIDELRANEKERFISHRILKYIEFWKLGMSKDDSYVKVMGPYVNYWESALELLSRPIPW